MTYTTKQTQFLETAIKVHGEGAILPKAVLAEVAEEAGTGFPYWLTNPKLDKCTKVSKGMYKIPSLSGEEVVPVIAVTEEKTSVKESISYKFLENTFMKFFNENDLDNDCKKSKELLEFIKNSRECSDKYSLKRN